MLASELMQELRGWVHQSHSAALQSDNDGLGKATSYDRETTGMGAKIDTCGIP